MFNADNSISVPNKNLRAKIVKIIRIGFCSVF